MSKRQATTRCAKGAQKVLRLPQGSARRHRPAVQALNVTEAPRFTVGMVPGSLESGVFETLLMTLDLRVTNDQVASIRTVNPVTGDPAEAIVCSLAGRSNLCAIDLNNAEEPGLAAVINESPASSGSRKLASGVYFAKLVAPGVDKTTRMILLQ